MNFVLTFLQPFVYYTSHLSLTFSVYLKVLSLHLNSYHSTFFPEFRCSIPSYSLINCFFLSNIFEHFKHYTAHTDNLANFNLFIASFSSSFIICSILFPNHHHLFLITLYPFPIIFLKYCHYLPLFHIFSLDSLFSFLAA